MRAYYFGCVGRPGHYMWAPGLISAPFSFVSPWGRYPDGNLIPPSGNRGTGRAMLHHKDGWTAIGFEDFSVDSRPGSNSVFLFEGTHTFEETVSLAEYFFPEIVKRFDFTITEYKP